MKVGANKPQVQAKPPAQTNRTNTQGNIQNTQGAGQIGGNQHISSFTSTGQGATQFNTTARSGQASPTSNPRAYGAIGLNSSAGNVNRTLPAHVNQELAKLPSEQREKATTLLKQGKYAEARNFLRMKTDFGTSAAGSTALMQLAQLADMKAAGIDASMPPKIDQLKSYFRTFKDAPEGGKKAAEAFKKYTQAFHKHPGKDVDYAKSFGRGSLSAKGVQTDAPRSIDEVMSSRARSDGSRTIQNPSSDGRTVNDCQGFAMLGKELLSEAGFDHIEYVNAKGKDGGHAMLVATKSEFGDTADGTPAIKNTSIVVSNDKVSGPVPRSDAKEELQSMLKSVDGMSGREPLYWGRTLPDAGAYSHLEDTNFLYWDAPE